jgi:hypothetical protein
MKKYFKYCLVVQVILAAWFQLLFWFRLGSVNAQPKFIPVYELIKENKLTIEDIVILLLFIIPVIVFYVGYRISKYWVMSLSIIFYIVWLILQVKSWWLPYIFGASDQWVEVYNRTFSHTHKILPAWGRHLPPDTMDLVIQVLLIVILFLFVTASLQLRMTRLKEPGARNRKSTLI